MFIGSRLVAMALGVGLLASTFGTAVGAESRSEAGGFPNAGFEGDVVDGTPTGWTHRYTSDTGTFEVVDSPVRTGSQALRMVDPSDVDQIGLLSDPAPVIPGQSYEAGVWALVERGIPSWVMYYYDADGVQIEQVQHRIRVATGDWTWESELTTAPENAATARFLLYSSTLDVTDVVWDEVSIDPVQPWPEESLGHPVEAANILDADYDLGADGRWKAYTVTAAVPARFQVIDIETGALEASVEFPSGATGSWSVLTASDGTVYVGVYNNGHLYRWLPESETLLDVGKATPSSLYLWDLEEDAEGRIWGGTYPEAELFSYDPELDEFTNHGRLGDEQYARSVAVLGDSVYAGLGSTEPRIIVHDIATGARDEIALPTEHQDNEFVYELEARQHLLFARLTPGNTTLVYDTKRGEWIDGLGATSFGTVSPAGPDGAVYFIDAQQQLRSYDLETGEIADTGVGGFLPARGFGWVELDGAEYPGQTLTFMYQTGEIVGFNPGTGATRTELSEVVSAPIKIQSIGLGPDGRVYSGGYMYEGIAAYDPATGETHTFPRGDVGQVEGMLAHAGELYLGSYTRANLHRFDPEQAWAGGTNPEHLGSLEALHQDRPFAWTSVGSLIATGTVPGYGHLGGVLALYDPADETLETFPDVVEDQSIVSLTAIDDTIYGSTSIYGGLGSVPTADTGRVFAWDVDTRSKLWEVELSPEAEAITAIEAGPDGSLWAVDMGVLYELDPATGEVMRSSTLTPYVWHAASVWVNADLKFNSEGSLFALSRGTVLRIDRDTLRTRTLATGATNYSLAVDGNDVYFARSDELVRVRGPEPPPPAWTAGQTYTGGDVVSHEGAVYEALWWTREEPGTSVWGSWQEIATAPDGTAVWTASRVFDTGDVVRHGDRTYVAKWWTRNEEPGERAGPWEVQTS